MKSYQRLLLIIFLLVSASNGHAQVVLPLKVSSNHRYLVDQKNKPVPILGRTAWFIISQPESGYKKFIDNTIEHGHNAIEMSAITHWPMGNHSPFNGNGDIPFLKRLDGTDWNGKLVYTSINAEGPDFISPNEKYWKYLDDFILYCDSKNMLVFMFPGYVGYDGGDQGWLREMVANGTKKTEAYGAWIANRYKNRKNIVWMLLGDFSKLNNEQKAAEAALIKGLKSVKGQQSIQYSAESHSGENSAEHPDFGNEMTLNGSYTWELKFPVPSVARRAYAYQPAMPSFLLEEPYDEEGPDGNNYNPNATQPVRRFQWWGWLSTIEGYISGNGYVWQFVDPVWEQHLNTQAALDMMRLNNFVKSIDWWKLIPSGLNGMKTLIVDENNIDTLASYVSAAVSADGSLLVAYIPPAHNGNINVDMTVLKGKVYARWFDPTNATYINVSDAPYHNKGMHTFSVPGKNSVGEKDWVLVIKAKK
ncbi:MAG TPA: DUF4038 domain-containing protein [Puia sp.]|nr:DUF4038 domain-containing protein [Puia sp.]